MSNFRICEFSSELFGGFQYKLVLNDVDSIEEIIGLAVSHLRTVLKNNLFDVLVEKVDKTHWHIHSHSFEDILLKENEKIWICDHCQETPTNLDIPMN